MKKVGIDDLATYIPKLYVDAKELAKERGIPPEKLTQGLEIEKLSIPDAHEDAATMAAMAAYELIEKNNLSPEDIDFIEVATESGPDASKPLSCYVQGMLEQIYGKGSFKHIGALETKFACVGATYALIDRLAYIASGWNKAEYSIVIATDIARYDLKSSGEPTQGAAAIAMLLKENPRLLAYEPEFTGFGTIDDKDFFRPIERKTAVVDGQYSVGCYLRNMKIAVDAYKQNMFNHNILKSVNESVSEKIDFASFHSPFPKMVKHAFASFLIHDWRDTQKWKRILKKIGPEPSRKGLSDVEFYVSEDYKDFRKKFMETKEFEEEYEREIEDSLVALREIGNSYTASVWIGVESHFENRKDDLAGKRLGIGSYGSGSSAIVCSFIVQPEYKDVIKKMDLMKKLANRKKISVSLYEELHEEKRGLDKSIIKPKNEFTLFAFGTTEKDWKYRYYRFVS